MTKKLVVPMLAALLCACVDLAPVPFQSGNSPAIDRAPFGRLDPGSYDQASLHFKVSAYGMDNARKVSDAAEAFYKNIMMDTNLYSFMPSGLYEIVVYNDQNEYMAKTKQPAWSGGVAYGNSIYSYMGQQLGETIAHEMTHLVFNEFMGRPRQDLLWLNEGLAVYEEGKALSGKNEPADIFGAVRGQIRAQPATMAQMLAFVPLQQKAGQGSDAQVTLWYAQAEGMVQYMMDKGGRLGFSQFLQGVKAGTNVDSAIGSAFPSWRDTAGFYQAWRTAL